MKILVCLYFSLLSAANIKDANIYSLFYHWNKMSISTLTRNAASPANETEKELYQQSQPRMIDLWMGNSDYPDNQTLRWRFLEQISQEFNWKDKEWSVIETIKSGEVTRILSYLICYNGDGAHVIMYECYSDGWHKVVDFQAHFSVSDLINKNDKVPAYQGTNSNDVVVTNFKSALPTQVAFYVSNTLAEGSKAKGVITRR